MLRMSFKTLNTNVAFRGRVLTVEEQEVLLPNGKIKTHVTVRHPGAVIIVPQTESGSIIFTKQYRHSIARELLELPAGTLEQGELPEHCAKREIQEEVNFKAASWTELGILHPAPGFCDEVQHCFLARELTPSSLPQDEDEFITPQELSPREVDDAICSGLITDAKTLACLTLLSARKL